MRFDDFDEEDFNSKSNNKIDFASIIKTVKNVIMILVLLYINIIKKMSVKCAKIIVFQNYF